MEEILKLIENPLVWKLLGGYWIFSSFVGALPQPTEKSHAVYKFAFGFFHGLAGNLKNAANAFKVPGSQ